MNKNDQWYIIHDAGEMDTPSLVIYPERVKENIRLLKRMINDTARLRPHVKTHKTIEASLMMMKAGINKFKCATIAEAEMLAMCIAPDVLLAYPPNGPKLDRFVRLIKKYPGTLFSCLVDNKRSAKSVAEIAVANHLTIPVYIDLNVGMNRTGIRPGRNAVELYEDCAKMKGIHLLGFHAYDGHIREKDIEKRKLLCEQSFAPVQEMITELLSNGYQQPKIIIGGSPSFPVYAQEEDLECSPGTFIFWDKGYSDSLPEQNFLYAALIVTRVVSMPAETKLCLDLGYKAIASENDLNNRVYFLNAPELKILSHSEEHMVVDAGDGHSYKVGDVLYALPVHICPTCAMYDTAVTVDNGQLTGTWDIMARRRKIYC